MSKNSKEKSSFWKKLGLGKNKTSLKTAEPPLHQKQQQQDRQEDNLSRSKRASSMYSLSKPQQQQQQQQQHQPPTPKPSVSHSFQNVDNSKTALLQKARKIPSPITATATAEEDMNPKTVDTSCEAIPSPTADLQPQQPNEPIDDVKTTTETTTKKTDAIATLDSTEQPNVTPAKDELSSDNEEETNKSISSFVVLDKAVPNDELLATIASLKQDLEKERATVNVLQKQKEAVAKDLDYLETTVDDLLVEKTDLVQQLEDEKIKSQHHLDDLNILLEKMKSTADNARGQSFAADQTRLEFEAYQSQAEAEKNSLLDEIAEKDKNIRELKYQLSRAQEQSSTFKETIDQLIKTHAAELSRATAQLQQHDNENKSNTWSLHTPNGSPRIQPKEEQQYHHHHQEEEEEDKEEETNYKNMVTRQHMHDASPTYAAPQSMTRMDSSERYRTPKESMEYTDSNDLDDQLMKLLKEKEKLQSHYSKIPLSGGGPQSRRRKEELEVMLDHVDSQLSKVRQRIKRS